MKIFTIAFCIAVTSIFHLVYGLSIIFCVSVLQIVYLIQDLVQMAYLLKMPTGKQKQRTKSYPKIYLGDEAPAPRWLIRPAPPESVLTYRTPAGGTPGGSPLKLGALQWVFDAGAATPKHGWDSSQLYEWAFRHLEYALGNAEVRDQLRDSIKRGPFASHVQHVEDPLPGLPSSPRSRHFEPEPLLTASAMDGGRYMYADYSRPSHAQRPVFTQVEKLRMGQNQKERISIIPSPDSISMLDVDHEKSSESDSSLSSAINSLSEHGDKVSDYDPGQESESSHEEEPESDASLSPSPRPKTRGKKASCKGKSARRRGPPIFKEQHLWQ